MIMWLSNQHCCDCVHAPCSVMEPQCQAAQTTDPHRLHSRASRCAYCRAIIENLVPGDFQKTAESQIAERLPEQVVETIMVTSPTRSEQVANLDNLSDEAFDQACAPLNSAISHHLEHFKAMKCSAVLSRASTRRDALRA